MTTPGEDADVERLERGWTFLEEHEDALQDPRLLEGWIRQLRDYERTWKLVHDQAYEEGAEAIRAFRAELHRLDV